MMKQRVRGPNMMRSQNPNPPNDLQEKGHQRAGLPEREVINECYGLSGYQLAPLKSCPNPGWLGLIVVLFEKIPSVDSSPTTPWLLIEKLSVSFSPILSEPICTSVSDSWHLAWELKTVCFLPGLQRRSWATWGVGCLRAAAVHMSSKTGSPSSLIGRCVHCAAEVRHKGWATYITWYPVSLQMIRRSTTRTYELENWFSLEIAV